MVPRAIVLVFAAAAAGPTPVHGAELTVAADEAALRDRCGSDAPPLARLRRGQTVKLRFALAGADRRCYSVSVRLDDRAVSGYVERAALEGMDRVDDERRAASTETLVRGGVESIAPPRRPTGAPSSSAPVNQAAAAADAGRPEEVARLLGSRKLSPDDLFAVALLAKAYLELTRPAEAFAALEPALARHPDDPTLLGLAGVSAFQRDRMPEALRYLSRAIEVEPNAALERLRDRVRMEMKSDRSSHQTFGTRFTLRYEGAELPPAAARELARSFDSEIARLTSRLGCRFSDRLTVIVRSLENYRAATGASEWSGGRYDGRIHIAVPPSGAVDEYVRSTFSHEFVHACLARIGSWPSWLHEGLAQKLSGDRLDGARRAELIAFNREGKLPSLSDLRGGWGGFSAGQAGPAYALALAAADLLYAELRDDGVRTLLNDPARVEEVERRIDRRLAETLR